MNIFLFIAVVFLGTFFLGKLLEKIQVPWIFAALVIGAGLAFYNPFEKITSSETFELFAQMGMYFLLFLVGFELDIGEMKKKGSFIFKSTFFIIFLEGLLGALVVHFVFSYDWLISLLVALSFATVGEAILVPILQEFKLLNTSLGQLIIGIGASDDIIEIILLILASILVGIQSQGNIVLILGSLVVLVLFTIGYRMFGEKNDRFKFASIETLFLFILFTFFLFIGVGDYAEAAPLAALLAGASIRLFISNERLVFVENELKSLTYGFFAPLFFVWVGAELNIEYLVAFPLLTVLVVVVSNGAKLLGSYIIGRKELGARGSILLGIGLSVRFSSSIIIIKFLFDNNIIGVDIYSVVVASSIIFNFIVPMLFSQLLVRWKFAPSSRKLSSI